MRDTENKLNTIILNLFNCNIDYDNLKFIFNEYGQYKDNPNIDIVNYPTVKHLKLNQSKRQEDFKQIVNDCLSDGLSSRYALYEVDGRVFVVEIRVKEFENMGMVGEYYEKFIL